MTEEDYASGSEKPVAAYDYYMLKRVEEVNDLLVEALDHADTYASHDEVRPSAIMAFDKMQQAHSLLSEIDPTREDP